MRIFTSNRGTIDKVFLSRAARYWIGVFPSACCEIRGWERSAGIIPDPLLRTLALSTLRNERGNLEGAAAYAAFTPPQHSLAVARAAMSFQAVYDYADALSEQPDSGSVCNTDRLHQALLVALRPGVPHMDYYAHQQRREDGGYLNCLVDKCREALGGLPSFPRVALQMQRAAARIVTYQSLNHQSPGSSYYAFEHWARKQASPWGDLRWWEMGAAAGSSLSVFALISAAAQPALDARHIAALECAYFPWIGSLHTLLDSLIDEREDARTEQHCLTARYGSQEETADRLQTLAIRASKHAKALPDGEHHMMILVAMVSFYLASPRAKDPHVKLAAERVLATLDENALPTMLILRTRHTISCLARARRHASKFLAP